jgi:hypothetical protein
MHRRWRKSEWAWSTDGMILIGEWCYISCRPTYLGRGETASFLDQSVLCKATCYVVYCFFGLGSYPTEITVRLNYKFKIFIWTVCHLCPILTKTGMCQHKLVKIQNMKFHENLADGNHVVPCAQTDRHNQANSCHSPYQSAKKKSHVCCEPSQGGNRWVRVEIETRNV